MEFGLLYELEMPKPWYDGQESDTYWQAIQQIEYAEDMGFEYVWTVEHDFLSEFSHSSAPEVFYDALSQRTKSIRLGHGVVLLPCPFNHPVRVAERIAALDIPGRGRVDFGTGRSITEEELGSFGVDPADSRPMWEEALKIIPRMWREDPLTYEGRYFKIPPRPKPVQKPHPPMWMATTQPDSFRLAGQYGLGVLVFLLGVEIPAFGRRVQDYREALKGCSPVGACINDQVAAFSITQLCRKQRGGAPGRRGVGDLVPGEVDRVLHRMGEAGCGRPRLVPLVRRGLQAHREARDAAVFYYLDEQSMVLVGDPVTIIDRIKKYEITGVDQILMFMQVGWIQHRQIMDSIRLIGKHVIPYFKNSRDNGPRPERVDSATQVGVAR